ncbi:3-methyl-2-oxobutanoate hydroxymethyltransferase [Paenibacillus polymyxa]|nr:3-methyl-2-oxobutanoate hydroxymethyltransferase [Paenibacillus polymyxa]
MKQTTDFMKMKQNNEKIVMLTAYDYPSAKQNKPVLTSSWLGIRLEWWFLVTIQLSQ